MKPTKDMHISIKNTRGMISAEFIFSLAICVGLCVVLFSLNFTLSMAEIAQYIAFSSARAHAAGNVDQDAQALLAKSKFNELINNPILKPLFGNPSGGWFKLTDFEVRGGGATEKTFDSEYNNTQTDRAFLVGVRFTFIPRLLNLKIAFLGSTSNDDSSSFSTKITGFLTREPTQKECWDLQIKPRYTQILNLDPRYKVLGNASANYYNPLEDNGC